MPPNVCQSVPTLNDGGKGKGKSLFYMSLNIKHITFPLYTSWIGSIWERIIKTVKIKFDIGCIMPSNFLPKGSVKYAVY